MNKETTPVTAPGEQRGKTPRCDNCGEPGNHRTDEGAGNWGSDGPPGFILEKNPALTYSCKAGKIERA